MSVIVYLFLDPSNYYLPFYAGKHSRQRMQERFRAQKDTELSRFILKLRERGVEPKLMIWFEGSPEDAKREKNSLDVRFADLLIRERHGNWGKLKPEGFGENIAAHHKGRKRTPETREKMRAAHARKPSRKGRRKLTDDEKAAISERVKKQWERTDRRLKQQLAFENKRGD